MGKFSIETHASGAHNRADANHFIETVTGGANVAVTFQTFPEGGPSDYGPHVLHGRLDDYYEDLVRLNRAGHGVFMMVNAGDGHGRRAENVVALRALFTDDDGDASRTRPRAAPPSMVVQSAHGLHTYWLLMPGEPLASFTPAQTALAAHFRTDPKVKDLPRVMRVPGFFHQKDRRSPFLVEVVETRPVRYRVHDVLAALPPAATAANEPMARRTVTPASNTSTPVRRARAYLSKVPGAVQGERGDSATYFVACVLMRDFALPFEDALSLMLEWNDKCVPPWSERDLIEKLQRAVKYGAGERGGKL